MKKVISTAYQVLIVLIFGQVNKLPNEPIIKGKVTYPENQPTLNEWCEQFNVSSRIPKYSQLSHHG
jgi:hypothetical protein